MTIEVGTTYAYRTIDANKRRLYIPVEAIEVTPAKVTVKRTDAPEIIFKVSPTTLEPLR